MIIAANPRTSLKRMVMAVPFLDRDLLASGGRGPLGKAGDTTGWEGI
jgi:hypothetical protein